MGSTFVSYENVNAPTGLFGSNGPSQVWLQFVPGIVKSVVTSIGEDGSGAQDNDPRKVNSILAFPHYGNELINTAELDEGNRYYPLLRGMVDVPTEGDQVLLCTFGGIQYYMGPVNTQNKPSWNMDHINLKRSEPRTDYEVKANNRDLNGLSKNFNEKNPKPRLQKTYKDPLDNPNVDKPVRKQIHGDLVFEGRHGNSMRVGSRDNDPYIFMSNGNVGSPYESILDSCLMSMTTRGTINQHLRDSITNPPALFVLASDTVEESKHLMIGAVGISNPGSTASEIVYGYNKSQIFQSSDRIVINAKTDSILLSSFQHVHIGAGRSMTISTNQDTIFDSTNIYLGQQAKKNADNNDGQGLVIGENLRTLLEQLVDMLIGMNGHCSGAPIPLGYNGGVPGTLTAELTKIKSALIKGKANFISTKHFIEENT